MLVTSTPRRPVSSSARAATRRQRLSFGTLGSLLRLKPTTSTTVTISPETPTSVSTVRLPSGAKRFEPARRGRSRGKRGFLGLGKDWLCQDKLQCEIITLQTCRPGREPLSGDGRTPQLRNELCARRQDTHAPQQPRCVIRSPRLPSREGFPAQSGRASWRP